MTRSVIRYLHTPILALALVAGTPPALAEQDDKQPTVELSAEASRQAPNDMAIASAYFEAGHANPSALSRQVNAGIAAALELARQYPTVKTRTSGTSTYPVYAKDARKIESWRMRSEIHMESRDIAALSELLGKLQGTLAVSQLVMQPAPETQKSVADLAATDAIHAFEARAQAISAILGKKYRIRHLAIGYGGTPRPVYGRMKASAYAAESAPLPVEAGDSEVTVNVNGTIELLD